MLDMSQLSKSEMLKEINMDEEVKNSCFYVAFIA